MAKKEEKKVLTRAQKTEATKGLIKELLAVKFLRHNELIDEVSKIYVERYEGEDTENINDVKGRVGSVLDIMKKESEVMYDGGMYALKARLPMPPPAKEAETPPPKKRTRAKKVEVPKAAEEGKVEETPVPKKRTRAKKVEEPKTEDVKVEEPKPEEKPTPKKRTRKAKTEEVKTTAEETPAPAPAPIVEEPKKEEKPVEVVAEISKATEVPKTEEKKGELVVPPKAEVARQNVVMDMSFLFGEKRAKPAPTSTSTPAPVPQKREEPVAKQEKESKPQEKPQTKREEKLTPAPTPNGVKREEKPAAKRTTRTTRAAKSRVEEKPLTAEEKLKESFLKKLRTLGGDYFEYYSVYLLERYSMKNGRRLESLRISGGDHDGGIDGEIELTDSLGFRETIYIQSKNWDPDKGRGESWVVGETLLQQFIGACACRQAKDGKQTCRGIFMTTSKFTPDAKRILDTMSDKIIGYDGEDIFEAAKECSFGVIKKGGEWMLDEELLSGSKAFFHLL